MRGRVLARKRRVALRDPKKEAIFKELAQILASSGYVIRREKLKRGHGWRVLSGSCSFKAASLIFVDQRMSQDDQISFLLTKILALRIPVSRDQTKGLPEHIQNQLS